MDVIVCGRLFKRPRRPHKKMPHKSHSPDVPNALATSFAPMPYASMNATMPCNVGKDGIFGGGKTSCGVREDVGVVHATGVACHAPERVLFRPTKAARISAMGRTYMDDNHPCVLRPRHVDFGVVAGGWCWTRS